MKKLIPILLLFVCLCGCSKTDGEKDMEVERLNKLHPAVAIVYQLNSFFTFLGLGVMLCGFSCFCRSDNKEDKDD